MRNRWQNGTDGVWGRDSRKDRVGQADFVPEVFRRVAGTSFGRRIAVWNTETMLMIKKGCYYISLSAGCRF